jgi:hypothetical protein
MQEVMTEEYIKKCAQAYALFVQAKVFISKEEKYKEGLSILKHIHNMIGDVGLNHVSYLESLTGDKQFTLGDFYEEMSFASYKVEDYESALCYTQRWKQFVEENYGYESAQMAHCLRRLGEIHYSMKQPEKEFEVEYGQPNSPMSLCIYILILASPFHWVQQNLQRPMEFYQEGYDLLKKAKGATAPETVKHKKLYVEFICEKTLAAHFSQTLWMLITIVPLLFILTSIMNGLSWHSLGVALLMTVLLLVWRIIGATFFYFMTKRHYERAIQ